jgi:DNA-binding response OmpR family regulator
MSRKKTVLVVDRGPQAAVALESRLLAAGYHVVARFSGATALDWLRSENADLLLLAVGLPDMSGFELCRRLRAQPATATIPVIFLAEGEGDDEEALQAHVSGDLYVPQGLSLGSSWGWSGCSLPTCLWPGDTRMT